MTNGLVEEQRDDTMSVAGSLYQLLLLLHQLFPLEHLLDSLRIDGRLAILFPSIVEVTLFAWYSTKPADRGGQGIVTRWNGTPADFGVRYLLIS